jgi:hypothetical protein
MWQTMYVIRLLAFALLRHWHQPTIYADAEIFEKTTVLCELIGEGLVGDGLKISLIETLLKMKQ